MIMTKAVAPMLVSLVLCGSAVAALAEAGQPTPPLAVAARRNQICQDEYARQVGDLAYLEAKLSLTAKQQPLFDRWKSVKLDIAKRGHADCSTRELPAHGLAHPPSPLEAMAREEDMLKRRLADLEAERPVLGALYDVLNPAQQGALMNPDGRNAAVLNRRVFDRAPSQ